MPPLLVLALTVILIIVIAVVMFWVLDKMKLPDPAAMIARIIVGVIVLLLLVGLLIPSLGIGLRLGP